MTPQDARAPIYGKGRRYRIVSRPNGYWRAEQRDTDLPGHNRDAALHRDHFDPWTPISRDTSKEAALALLPKD